MWLWKRRERFSLEELKYLIDQLQKVSSIGDYNKEVIIETLRSIAELMTWGDQHDPSFFEYFMERQVLALFIYILKMGNKYTSIAVQLLQSMIIMIQNILNDQAICYLLSNECVNYLITYPFDFHNEELLAYYISFLRTVSMKLDKDNVAFFIMAKDDEIVSFPLYSQAIKFFHHEDSMVRIAVRTLTLNVYNVDDDSIRKFVMSPQVVGYFSDLVTFLRQQSCTLGGLVADAFRTSESGQSVGRLEAGIAETEELLDYCNDIICAGIADLSHIMTDHVLRLLVVPLLGAMYPTNESIHVSPLSSLYLLCQLLHIVKHKPLVKGIGAALLHRPTFLHEKVQHDTHGGNENLSSTSNCVDADSLDGMKMVLGVKEDEEYQLCPWEILLNYIRGNDDKLVLASLCLLISLVQNEVLDDIVLDALGLLPRLKQHKKNLLQTLMGNNSEEDILFSFPTNREVEDFVEAERWTSGKEIKCSLKNLEKGELKHNIAKSGIKSNSYSFKICDIQMGNTAERKQQVQETLLHFLCRRPLQCVESLCPAGWLLWQIYPCHEDSSHSLQLQDAYATAKEDLLRELYDCWCDVLPTVVAQEWEACKKALEAPSVQKLITSVFMPTSRRPTSSDDSSSFAVAERMHKAVKVFVGLRHVQSLFAQGFIEDEPPFVDNRSGGVEAAANAPKVGTEFNLTPGSTMPCKVAFERGKERAVHLIVTAEGTSGWLLLVDDASTSSHGVIRVVAPLAGCMPEIDREHRRWLHLRIRSPRLIMFSTPGRAETANRNGSRTRRLIDGRWTLAFADYESCSKAKLAIEEGMKNQRTRVMEILQPLLDLPISAASSQKSDIKEVNDRDS